MDLVQKKKSVEATKDSTKKEDQKLMGNLFSNFETIQKEILQIHHEIDHLTQHFNRGWNVRLDAYGFVYCIIMVSVAFSFVLAILFLLSFVISYFNPTME